MPPRSSRTAFRNLLLVLAITLGVLIFSYSWTVTDINLDKPQEPTRQANLSNAMRELLSPRIFEQDRAQASITTPILFGCEEGDAPEEGSLIDGQPSIYVTPTCGLPGDIVTVHITGFEPEADAQIRWVPETGQSRPRDIIGTGSNIFVLDDSGGYNAQIEIPRIAGATGQIHQVELRASTPVGAVRLSTTSNEVLVRMVETIFMALIATALAIPISVLISFFAAHNLMRPIRMPLGSAMVWVAALPFGYVLGTLLLTGLGNFAFDLTSGQLFNATTALIPLMIGLGAVAAKPFDLGHQTGGSRTSVIIQRVLVAVVLVIVIGLIGGLGLLGERFFHWLGGGLYPENAESLGGWLMTAAANLIFGFGTMIGLLGELVRLLMTPVSGLIGAFAFASMVVSLAKPVLRNATGTLNTGLGFVLGGISGMFVMFAAGYIGMSAALFGLFPPIVAAMLGQAAVSGVLNKFLPERAAYEKTASERTIRWFGGLVGAIGAFVLTFIVLGTGRALTIAVLPSPEVTGVFGLPHYVIQIGIIGAVLGAVSGGMSGVRSTFMIGDVLYNITRNILNALRSIEPLIMGLIFVVWVGIGPFAGVLALMLHSIASLGKLYSEQIETIDNGPIEALQSTGANHLQTIIYAVVPQIIPPYIAFTMYRWDINVRMSTIIGFVGGGGIGLLLNQQINLLRYRDAGVAVLAIAVVVSILDYASAKIRERIL